MYLEENIITLGDRDNALKVLDFLTRFLNQIATESLMFVRIERRRVNHFNKRASASVTSLIKQIFSCTLT